MENKKNTNLLIGLGVALAIIIVVWFVMGKTPVAKEEVNNTQIAVESTEDLSTPSVRALPGAAPLSYTDALVQYKDARLQLDKDCRADLTNSTFKNNSSIMIDNRSDKPRNVKVGSVFPIKPWGFKIVKLSSSTLPTIWYVDCDNSQNVATISIQR